MEPASEVLWNGNITDPKKKGYMCSVKPYFDTIWKQKRNSCAAYATRDVVTGVYRMMKTDKRQLNLSPSPLLCEVKPSGLSNRLAQDIVMNFGLEESDGPEIDEENIEYVKISDYKYRTEVDERYFIKKFKIADTFCSTVQASWELLQNFRPDGNCYPVVGVLLPMMEFKENEVAARTTKENPFYWGEKYSRGLFHDKKDNLLPGYGYHTVVITGIFTKKDNPKPLDYSIEIKNSYGTDWGNAGYAWATVDIFDMIYIPVEI